MNNCDVNKKNGLWHSKKFQVSLVAVVRALRSEISALKNCAPERPAGLVGW